MEAVAYCDDAIEPKHAGDDKADHQCDDRLCVGMDKVYPGRRVREPAGLRQIIGEQRHRNAEDGVAQRLQSAHFEKTDLLQPRPPQSRRTRDPDMLSSVGLSDIDCPLWAK